jgi:hypothetical protein
MRWLAYLPSLTFAAFAYFVPPPNWNPIDPTKLSSSIEIGFISPSHKLFKPSLNFTREKFTGKPETYISALKRVHTADRKNKWIEIGYVETKSGRAHVAQIDSHKEWGHVRLLQMTLLHGDHAYLITAVASRDEFPNYHNLFLKTFESLWVGPSLNESLTITELATLEKLKKEVHSAWKGDFANKTFQKKGWVPMEKKLRKVFKPLGLHWQVHALTVIRDTLLESPAPQVSLLTPS